MVEKQKILWLAEPEDHDYPAAEDYLTLVFTNEIVTRAVRMMRTAAIRKFKAKDILRASALTELTMANRHVSKNVKKIQDEKAISPVLLMRNDGRLIIADGYHRVCAVYLFDEDAEIPCKLV